MDIRQDIKKWITRELSIEGDFAVEHPKEMDHGDYAVNIALIEGKKQGKNPKDLAGEFVEVLRQAQDNLNFIEKIEIAGPGFINIFLKKEFFADKVGDVIKQGETFGKNSNLKGEKFFIEHTQPNPFKEFHIGHLMNNAIGESVARIVRANGAEVKTASYHGNKGLHVAKAVWALQNGIPYAEAYAYGNKAYEESDENKEEITEINKKIYSKEEDSKVYQLYEDGMKTFLSDFTSTCEKLDSHFDFHFYESESGEVGKKLVLENIPKVFVESEGATIFKGEDFEPKTHTRVFLNKDGIPTYEAKELGLAEIKKEKFAYDVSLTITANEQDSFFRVVEVAIGEVFPELKGKLKHLSHGLLKLPSGKMSSRTGSIIKAEALLADATEKVLEKMADRQMSDEEKNATAEIVAIGAIKYSILHQTIGKDIIFDFDKSLSFEGDSGPYLQYSYVRSQSVLKKAPTLRFSSSEVGEPTKSVGSITSVPDSWVTTRLERLIARFTEVVARAGEEYAPHYIATYLIELAGAFNHFYAENKIADASDSASGYKLALTESFGIVMKNGLNLLGIKVPSIM